MPTKSPTRNLAPLEEVVQMQIAQWIRATHPDVIFSSDGAGLHLSKAQAGKRKMQQSGRGYPDLFLAAPRGRYYGMFIELKREGSGWKLKDGRLSTDAHIQEQAAQLQRLVDLGYCADFSEGYEPTIKLIDWYLKLSDPA